MAGIMATGAIVAGATVSQGMPASPDTAGMAAEGTADDAGSGGGASRARMAAAFSHDRPASIDAVVSRMALPIAANVTVETAKGFALYGLKAVILGHGGERVDLARTSLWR
jgi:pyruvate dehydrogenase (quinone)